MAPPTRLRPHLNDLLQKNLELEHVVADLRHQLTQSSAKWAEERKMLATGCDTLMASFANFRARLDIHASDWGDSEGEVEQNLDTVGQIEEAGEVDHGVQEASEGDQQSSVVDHLREKCHALAIELQVKEEELEDSRRKHEATEEELKRVQQSLETRSEQLRTALASSKTESENNVSPERPSEGTPSRATTSQPESEVQGTVDKLDQANQEITRLKKLLQEWQKYAGEWKRDAQFRRGRVSELERREQELSAQVEAAKENNTLLDTEREEVQRLTGALAEQTAAVEHQRTASQESTKRVQELEAMIAFLRAQLSHEKLAAIDSNQNQVTSKLLSLTKSPTPDADTNTNRRSDMIMLKIPYRSALKPSGECKSNGSQEGQQNAPTVSQQASAIASTSANPAPQTSNTTPKFNAVDYELCIHTCNPLPCRNESQSFLWLRKQASLPRHAVSAKKHRRCTSDCPGYRFLTMPVADAMKEPRRAKCRPPSEAELALAEEESTRTLPNELAGERGTEVEEEPEREGSGDPEEPEEHDEGSIREEEVGRERQGELSPRNTDTSLGKRLRSRPDGEESMRSRKLRPRTSTVTKS